MSEPIDSSRAGAASRQDDLSARSSDPLVSLIVPVLNEAEAIPPFVSAVTEMADQAQMKIEILFVDDGSTDGTAVIIDLLIAKDDRIRLISLSRRFGKEAALTAGIDHADGDVLVPIDVDLQDPPEVIPRFVEKWREGYAIVHGVRASRHEDSILKRVTANMFYRLFNKMTTTPIPENVGDFQLIDRKAAAALALFRERNRFMKGLFAAVGFETATVEYVRTARKHGKTKYNYWRLWNFALDGIIGYSTVPLRIWTYIGFLIALGSFIYALFIIATVLVYGTDVPGYASLLTVVLFINGIQLISLGIIGEYTSRMFIETKMRPIYIVKRLTNIQDRKT